MPLCYLILLQTKSTHTRETACSNLCVRCTNICLCVASFPLQSWHLEGFQAVCSRVTGRWLGISAGKREQIADTRSATVSMSWISRSTILSPLCRLVQPQTPELDMRTWAPALLQTPAFTCKRSTGPCFNSRCISSICVHMHQTHVVDHRMHMPHCETALGTLILPILSKALNCTLHFKHVSKSTPVLQSISTGLKHTLKCFAESGPELDPYGLEE